MIEAAARAPAALLSIAVASPPSSPPADRRAAAALAERLRLPLLEGDAGAELLLVAADGRLALLEPATGARLALDYTPEEARRYRANAARDPLLRAVGGARRVVDATAGLGRDAVHLAWAGRRVYAIERHPVVAALVGDALARGAARGALAPGAIELRVGEAVEVLRALRPRPEVVYLDPMFPAKRKSSAAARKEMRLLRRLAGKAEDATALFEAAREAARERVVVKRPDHAPPLAPRPAVSYGGKLVRYDVYRTAGAP